MNKNVNTFLFCGFFGLAAGIIAAVISPWSWWIGLAVGSIMGGAGAYLATNWKETLAVVPKAWGKAKKQKRGVKVNLKVSFKEVVAYLLIFLWLLVWSVIITCCLCIFSYYFLAILMPIDELNSPDLIIVEGIMGMLVLSSFLTIIVCLAVFFLDKDCDSMFDDTWKGLLRYSPFVVLTYDLTMVWCPYGFRFSFNFIKYLFVAIYSEKRLSNGLSVVLAAVISFLFFRHNVPAFLLSCFIMGGSLGIIGSMVLYHKALLLAPKLLPRWQWGNTW